VGSYYANAGKSALKRKDLKKEQDYLPFFGLLIYDGYWDESIQTTTLVIVSTLIALILVFRWEFCCSK
jgi:glycine betaine/proline transport system permease protein